MQITICDRCGRVVFWTHWVHIGKSDETRLNAQLCKDCFQKTWEQLQSCFDFMGNEALPSIEIEVRGGVVQEVSNLPSGWAYTIIDYDDEAARPVADNPANEGND